MKLNEELGIRIWSFPMRYQPTDRPDRGHIGEKWTRYQLRSMQIVLQATHGVVSGEPKFFKRAFGDTADDFHRILMMPHDFVFNRDWYERLEGRSEFEAYEQVLAKLTESDRAELLGLLSSSDPKNFAGLKDKTANPNLLRALPYYVPRPEEFLEEIWERQKFAAAEMNVDEGLADDERVEDAGLDFEEEVVKLQASHARAKAAA